MFPGSRLMNATAQLGRENGLREPHSIPSSCQAAKKNHARRLTASEYRPSQCWKRSMKPAATLPQDGSVRFAIERDPNATCQPPTQRCFGKRGDFGRVESVLLGDSSSAARSADIRNGERDQSFAGWPASHRRGCGHDRLRDAFVQNGGPSQWPFRRPECVPRSMLRFEGGRSEFRCFITPTPVTARREDYQDR